MIFGNTAPAVCDKDKSFLNLHFILKVMSSVFLSVKFHDEDVQTASRMAAGCHMTVTFSSLLSSTRLW